MKKLYLFLFAACLLSLAACSNDEDTAAPLVALPDVAAEAVPVDEIVPADINEVAIATEEMILAQPMEVPMPQPPSGEPFAEPAEDAEEATVPPA